MSLLKSNFSVLTIGECFRHYKGAIYRIKGIGTHTETEIEHVIYYDITKPEKIWLRPVIMFNEKLIINNKEIQRFTKITVNNFLKIKNE